MEPAAMSVAEFCGALAAGSPAPGGGSTAALEGALGAALIEMVAALTAGNKKYGAHEELMRRIAANAAKLREELVRGIDRDTEAFQLVSAVFSMPRDTDGQRAARKEAMQEGLRACTIMPYDVMCHALAALQLAEEMEGRFNRSAASDLGVAALSLKAAAQGAWLNILINIGSIADRAFAGQYRAAGEELLAKAIPLADSIYQRVLESL